MYIVSKDWQDTYDEPIVMPTKYYSTPIKAFKEGKGWDAKDPISGLELIHKPAFILIASNPKSKKHIDDNLYVTDKFILQSITENRTEKVQILETFGESAAISFFDMRTRVYQISGTLIEANGGPKINHYKWASAFKHFYENHLRATQLARKGKIAVLTVQENSIYCYPISLNISGVASNPHLVTFSMHIIVTKHILTANSTRSLDLGVGFDADMIDEWLGLYAVKDDAEKAEIAVGETKRLSKEYYLAREIFVGAVAKYMHITSAGDRLKSDFAKALKDPAMAVDYMLTIQLKAQVEVDLAENVKILAINEWWDKQTDTVKNYRGV